MSAPDVSYYGPIIILMKPEAVFNSYSVHPSVFVFQMRCVDMITLAFD
jgi:hypothetical protein